MGSSAESATARRAEWAARRSEAERAKWAHPRRFAAGAAEDRAEGGVPRRGDPRGDARGARASALVVATRDMVSPGSRVGRMRDARVRARGRP